MKKTMSLIMSQVLALIAALPALAQTGAREDNSMVLVYLFLATCALIILLQLIPVFTLLFGMIKGLFGKREEESKPASVKYQ